MNTRVPSEKAMLGAVQHTKFFYLENNTLPKAMLVLLSRDKNLLGLLDTQHCLSVAPPAEGCCTGLPPALPCPKQLWRSSPLEKILFAGPPPSIALGKRHCWRSSRERKNLQCWTSPTTTLPRAMRVFMLGTEVCLAVGQSSAAIFKSSSLWARRQRRRAEKKIFWALQ